jgi:hypothetical protein
MAVDRRRLGAIVTPLRLALVLAAPVVLPASPALAQSAPNPPEEKPPAKERPASNGVEIEVSSGHADRGLVISDRPVVQPVVWVSGRVASFWAWTNFTLAETTDGSLPQILEMELTRELTWGNLTIGPAVRTYFYSDRMSIYSSRSMEGWLYLSYDVGPFRLFANQSLDVLTYPGAYFGTAGIELEGHVSQHVEVGGVFGAGWASWEFNDAYVGIDKSTFNRVSVEGWLTAYVKPHFYVGPIFEFSTTVDREVRAELDRPTFFFIGITTGVEF